MVISLAFLRIELHPETAMDTVLIQTELPTGTPFDANVAQVKLLQQAIRDDLDPGDIKNISTVVGHHDTDMFGSSDGLNQAWAMTTVQFSHRDDMTTSHKKALQKVKDIAAKQTQFSLIYAAAASGAPVLGEAAELEIMSEDSQRFKVAEDMKDF